MTAIVPRVDVKLKVYSGLAVLGLKFPNENAQTESSPPRSPMDPLSDLIAKLYETRKYIPALPPISTPKKVQMKIKMRNPHLFRKPKRFVEDVNGGMKCAEQSESTFSKTGLFTGCSNIISLNAKKPTPIFRKPIKLLAKKGNARRASAGTSEIRDHDIQYITSAFQELIKKERCIEMTKRMVCPTPSPMPLKELAEALQETQLYFCDGEHV